MYDWTAQDAQKRFGALVDAAKFYPQTVTRRGEPVAVVMSLEVYHSLLQGNENNKSDFVEHLLAIPKARDDEPELERIPIRPRDLEG